MDSMIRILIMASVVVVPIAVILFVVLSQRDRNTIEQVPSYNELKVDNAHLRRENQELKDRLGEFDT